jgi:hypothetical protein
MKTKNKTKAKKTIKQARDDFDKKSAGNKVTNRVALKSSKKKKKAKKVVLLKEQPPVSNPKEVTPNWFTDEELALEGDFLDEIVKERKTPKFPDIAAEIERKTSKKLKSVTKKPMTQMDHLMKDRYDSMLERNKRAVEIPSVTLILGAADGSSQIFSFNFFECVKDDADRGEKSFVASCQNTYGEGEHWASAYADCIRKMVNFGLLRNN